MRASIDKLSYLTDKEAAASTNSRFPLKERKKWGGGGFESHTFTISVNKWSHLTGKEADTYTIFIFQVKNKLTNKYVKWGPSIAGGHEFTLSCYENWRHTLGVELQWRDRRDSMVSTLSKGWTGRLGWQYRTIPSLCPHQNQERLAHNNVLRNSFSLSQELLH